MPTGGVAPTVENLTGWFNAGAVCVGMGSKLISKDILKNRDFKQLEAKTSAALQTIKDVRS